MYRALVHGGDEVGKLTGPDRMMSQVTPDDFRREKWTDGLSIHGSLRDLFFAGSIYEAEKHLKDKKYSAPSSILSLLYRPNLAGAVMILRKPARVVAGISGSRRLTWPVGFPHALTCLVRTAWAWKARLALPSGRPEIHARQQRSRPGRSWFSVAEHHRTNYCCSAVPCHMSATSTSASESMTVRLRHRGAVQSRSPSINRSRIDCSSCCR
jgi:hypothetical protein